jgi:hypothetical protein
LSASINQQNEQRVERRSYSKIPDSAFNTAACGGGALLPYITRRYLEQIVRGLRFELLLARGGYMECGAEPKRSCKALSKPIIVIRTK